MWDAWEGSEDGAPSSWRLPDPATPWNPALPFPSPKPHVPRPVKEICVHDRSPRHHRLLRRHARHRLLDVARAALGIRLLPRRAQPAGMERDAVDRRHRDIGAHRDFDSRRRSARRPHLSAAANRLSPRTNRRGDLASPRLFPRRAGDGVRAVGNPVRCADTPNALPRLSGHPVPR